MLGAGRPRLWCTSSNGGRFPWLQPPLVSTPPIQTPTPIPCQTFTHPHPHTWGLESKKKISSTPPPNALLHGSRRAPPHRQSRLPKSACGEQAKQKLCCVQRTCLRPSHTHGSRPPARLLPWLAPMKETAYPQPQPSHSAYSERSLHPQLPHPSSHPRRAAHLPALRMPSLMLPPLGPLTPAPTHAAALTPARPLGGPRTCQRCWSVSQQPMMQAILL